MVEPFTLRYAMAKDYLDNGKTVNDVCRILGLTFPTVNRIKKGKIGINFQAIELIKKAEASLLTLVTNQILTSISQQDIDKANVLQKASAYGILFDKRRLAEGKSTENINFQGLVNELHGEIERIKTSEKALEE
jgi:hypothetical protein